MKYEYLVLILFVTMLIVSVNPIFAEEGEPTTMPTTVETTTTIQQDTTTMPTTTIGGEPTTTIMDGSGPDPTSTIDYTSTVHDDYQCPQVDTDPPYCSPNEVLKSEYDNQGCFAYYYCLAVGEPTTTVWDGTSTIYDDYTTTIRTEECPERFFDPANCEYGMMAVPEYDSNGCYMGEKCKPDFRDCQCPMIYIEPPECGPDSYAKEDYDDCGCRVGYHCEGSGDGIECNSYEKSDGRWINCWIEFGKCVCSEEGGGSPGQPPVYCPEYDKCPDGSQVKCWSEGNGCRCEECRTPDDCVKMRDPNTGFVHVVCGGSSEVQCPYQMSDAERSERKDRCYGTGGRVKVETDDRGCEKIACDYSDEDYLEDPDFFQGYDECMPEEEVDRIKRKCEENNMKIRFFKEGGCNFPECVEGYEENTCKHMPHFERESQEKECYMKGGYVAMDFDDQGCQIVNCFDAGEDHCLRLPPEAFERCRQDGGELIAKDDSRGCVIWQECVKKGDGREVYFEPIKEVPDITVLMDIAFKLEGLKIELNELVKKSKELADYYSSSGAGESERFERVAQMFEIAKQDVDRLKNKLANMLDNPDIGNLEQIRHELRELKDVRLKDILYMMLSTDPEVSIGLTEEGSCGYDGRCFDESLRLCKPTKFYPDTEVVLSIEGIEDGKCKIYVTMQEGKGPPVPMEMTCFKPDFANGMKGPEDLFPHCLGSMKDFVDEYGMPEGPGGPGGPEEECMMDCMDGSNMRCGPDIDDPQCRRCEEKCGLMGSGPGGSGMNQEEKCIMECVGSGIQCMPGPGGEQNPACERCANECTKYYEGPCLTEKDLDIKERQCSSRCEHCYGEPIEGDSGEGYQCIVAIECKDASDEFGDDAGTGPASYDEGKSPYDEGGYGREQREYKESSEACVGCLNNGVCDPGECSGCPDCK